MSCVREGVAARERSSPRDRAMATRLQAVLHAGLDAWDAAPTGKPVLSSLVREPNNGGITVPVDKDWNKLKARIESAHSKRLDAVKEKNESAKSSAVKCIEKLLETLTLEQEAAESEHTQLLADMEALVRQKDEAFKKIEEQCKEDKLMLENGKNDELELQSNIGELRKALETAQGDKVAVQTQFDALKIQMQLANEKLARQQTLCKEKGELKKKVQEALEEVYKNIDIVCGEGTAGKTLNRSAMARARHY